MKYLNLTGHGGRACFCKSWLHHFRQFGQGSSASCSVRECVSEAQVGGFIQEFVGEDKSWYVVPMCKSCNNTMLEPFYLKDNITPAPCVINETCGKVLRKK